MRDDAVEGAVSIGRHENEFVGLHVDIPTFADFPLPERFKVRAAKDVCHVPILNSFLRWRNTMFSASKIAWHSPPRRCWHQRRRNPTPLPIFGRHAISMFAI